MKLTALEAIDIVRSSQIKDEALAIEIADLLTAELTRLREQVREMGETMEAIDRELDESGDWAAQMPAQFAVALVGMRDALAKYREACK